MKDVLAHWVIYCNESHDPEEGSLSCRLAALRLDKALSVKDMGKLPLNPVSQYLWICLQPGYLELINICGLYFLLQCAFFLGSKQAPAWLLFGLPTGMCIWLQVLIDLESCWSWKYVESMGVEVWFHLSLPPHLPSNSFRWLIYKSGHDCRASTLGGTNCIQLRSLYQ